MTVSHTRPRHCGLRPAVTNSRVNPPESTARRGGARFSFDRNTQRACGSSTVSFCTPRTLKKELSDGRQCERRSSNRSTVARMCLHQRARGECPYAARLTALTRQMWSSSQSPSRKVQRVDAASAWSWATAMLVFGKRELLERETHTGRWKRKRKKPKLQGKHSARRKFITDVSHESGGDWGKALPGGTYCTSAARPKKARRQIPEEGVRHHRSGCTGLNGGNARAADEILFTPLNDRGGLRHLRTCWRLWTTFVAWFCWDQGWWLGLWVQGTVSCAPGAMQEPGARTGAKSADEGSPALLACDMRAASLFPFVLQICSCAACAAPTSVTRWEGEARITPDGGDMPLPSLRHVYPQK